jgi:hypothetical protein
MAKTKNVPTRASSIGSRTKKGTPKPSGLTTAQRERLAAFNRYIARHMKDDSGEQEQTWSILKKALDDNRTSTRRHFRE